MPFDRATIQTAAARLAKKGVCIGTSSWKYEGWFDHLYTPARYEYRGKVAKTRFQRECLSEYAEVFKTVCVDAAYYTFPSLKYLEGMASQVTPDFRFAFKVTDESPLRNSRIWIVSRIGRASATKLPERRPVRHFVLGAVRSHPGQRRPVDVRVLTLLAE
jgi:hypothetical protein